MKGLSILLVLGALGVGFVAGRSSLPAGTALTGTAPVTAPAGAGPVIQPLAQLADRALAVTLPGDPRELIPLVPGPGEGPGQTPQPGSPQPGPQQPGQAPGEGECTVLLHRDGQFYRLQPGQPGPGQPQPGQGQPGQPQPGQGGRGDGQPGSDSDELFPLEPFGPGPGLPGLPPSQPDTPGLDLRV